jgi:predicted Zn-dependent peptidase
MWGAGALALALVGCGGVARNGEPTATAATVPFVRAGTPDEPFRASAPPPSQRTPYTPPPIEEFRLGNGIRVLFVPRDDMPIMTLCVVSTVGVAESHARPGAMLLLMTVLRGGSTSSHSGFELALAREAAGTELNSTAEWDSGSMCARSAAPQAEATIDLLAEKITHPRFDESYVETVRARELASLGDKRPRSVALEVGAIGVYGPGTPYANTVLGSPEQIRALRRADLVAAYEESFSPATVTIVAAGAVTRTALGDMLARSFGAWSRRAPRAARAEIRASDSHPVGPGPVLMLVPRAKAEQADVYVVARGPAAMAPERDAAMVLNALLGGRASARLNMNLREEHAYSYGVFSAFTFFRRGGPFYAGGAIEVERTTDAIAALFAEIERVRAGAFTPEELAATKTYLARGLPNRLETTGDIASALTEIAARGLPVDDFATREARYDRVTADDVRKVAEAYLAPRALSVVIVGEPEKVRRADIQRLGFTKVEFRDVSGRVVRVVPP